jgi:hypothetical protein
VVSSSENFTLFHYMKYAVCANSDLEHSLGLNKRGDVFFVTRHTSLVSMLRIADTKLNKPLYKYTLLMDRN